ncbi:hypothetical protein ACH495_10240 [Micromonospora sp. NPDC018662]|uniref:hypothetical protein n=1 Tax=Micromonospora sp. NPDC018662 TaxID=3364238 RepID=UPI00379C0B6D
MSAAAVRVEAFGAALLLRTGVGPVGALRAATAALGRAHPETVLVTAPAVTGRDGLFDLVTDALAGAARSGDRIRLVLLGRGPGRAAREEGARLVAHRFGRPVTVSLGPVTVAPDGSCVSVAEPGDPGRRGPERPGDQGGWYAVGGSGPAEGWQEPPWSPAPSWPTLPAPRRWTGPGLVARPVPAGLWLVPPDVRPGGVGGSIAREPDAATILVGGCGAPVAVEELSRAVAALRPDPASRLVLLPGAVPAGTPADRLHDLPVRLRAAVPALTRAGWRLAPVTPGGMVIPAVEGTPTADGPGATAGAGPAVTTIRPDPADPPPRTGPYTTGRRPVAGRATAAGWSFLAGADVLGVAPAAAATVVEVDTDPRGFLIRDRAIGAADFADLLGAVLGPGAGPLVLTGSDAGRPTAIVADLASAWGATVFTSAGPVALTATGVLLASAGFRAHPPGASSRPVGSTLPATGAGLDDLAARSTPATPPRPVRPSAAAVRVDEPTAAGAATGRTPTSAAGLTRRLGAALVAAVRPRTGDGGAAPDPVGPDRPRPEPPAAVDDGPASDPTTGLICALGPDFHRYAAELTEARRRAGVTRTEEPDPELVALRAYGTGDRADVNAYLRAASAPGREVVGEGSASRPAVVATGVVAALRRSPLVFGSVFAAAGVPVAGAPGQRLVEPGFVDARLTPGVNPAASVEYVIWSTTARRLDGIFLDGAPVAVFAPGSRFEVLAVEPVGERSRVYLADLGAGRTADPDVLLARLRRDAPDRPGGDVPMIAPIGFADSGRPFVRPA